MLINKPKKGDTVYWMTLNFDVLHADTLVMSNRSMPRIHSGKVVSYSNSGVVKLEVLVSEKFLNNKSYHTSGLKLLKTKKGGIQRAEIGMPDRSLYGSYSELKLAIIKFITNDFDTDEIQ